MVPEHSSRTLSYGEGSLELLWFTWGMRMHLLFGLLFCFFSFKMDLCLVPCDSGSAGEMLRRRPFAVFCDGWTASWEPISHTVCGNEVSRSWWYGELTLKFQETKLTGKFLESPDPLAEQDHQSTFASFPDCLHHERLYVMLQSSCTIAALCCHS